MRLRIGLLTALLLTGAANAYTLPAIEPVYGVVVGKDAITVRVAGSCTRKSDMTVAVAKNPPRPMVLIARKRADGCLQAGGQAEVVYSFEELGLKAGEAF